MHAYIDAASAATPAVITIPILCGWIRKNKISTPLSSQWDDCHLYPDKVYAVAGIVNDADILKRDFAIEAKKIKRMLQLV